MFESIPLTTWFSMFGAGSGLGGLSAWYFGYRNARATAERTHSKVIADILAVEADERSTFRAALMAEIAALRLIIKECDVDKEALRARINVAEGEIQVLRAANEIMERWVAFFKAHKDAIT